MARDTKNQAATHKIPERAQKMKRIAEMNQDKENQAGLSRASYLSRNLGDYGETVEFAGKKYKKVEDLRYGTNPHQTAAFYRPVEGGGAIGSMEVLKSGKSGLSQTNLEDISYALNIVKFFEHSACACMKHVNPSGAAVTAANQRLVDVYCKARDCDPRAAFGSVVAFNTRVDCETAAEIMNSFVECVVAPDFSAESLSVFEDAESKLNRNIRIIRCGSLNTIPKFTDEESVSQRTVKILHDGSMVIADPLLTNVRGIEDLPAAAGASKKMGEAVSTVEPALEQMNDLLTAWYINLNVRSNGVVLVKDGGTLAIGTGEQDRVGAVEQALVKYRQKYQGTETIAGAVMASDGFFPFPDAVETAAQAGVKAIVAPAGSLRDAAVIARANELGVALRHAPERIFSHH